MTTHLLWPSHPHFVTASEEAVWAALRDQLGPRDLLIANQRFTSRQRDHELDLAVVLDGHGVVVLEVKGGKVWFEDGQWWQPANAGPRRIDPIGQALGNKHVLKDWVEASDHWLGHGAVRWAHGIVLPHVDVALGMAAPDLTRQMVVDRSDLADIASKVRTMVDVLDTPARPTNVADATAIHGALSGRFLPQRGTLDLVGEAVAERDELVERLSEEQGVILDAIRLLDRVEIRGGAGSGKTWLAVEQARRLAREGRRVAIVCYSRGLAAWLQRRVDTLPADERPAYVGTFHGLGTAWGAAEGTDDDSDFWENRLPAQMVQIARDLPMADLFDAIVVDEAQDFADAWWPVVRESLKFEDGGIYVFSDEGQRIFSRFGNAPAGLVPLVLEQNLRNTRQISEAFVPFAPNPLRASDHEGPPVRFVECSPEQALDVADDQVEALIDAGWEPSDLALLATGHRHPEQYERQQRGQDAYWDSFWDDDQVFYGHVLGFKGLERPAVVLAINEKSGRERARERLYVGLSRARDLLVVCGDPQHILDVAGPDVLARLRGR